MKGFQKLLIIVSVLSDIINSTLHFFALNFISGSAFQIIQGGSIIATFIFSILFLKKPVFKKNLIGSILAFVGILIVGIANLIFSDENGSKNQIGGIVNFFAYFRECRLLGLS